MSEPEHHLTTVAVVDADRAALAEKVEALRALDGVEVRIAAGSLGELLTDPAFPPDVAIIEQREGERVTINYKIRVCRLANARVIVVADKAAERSGELAPDVASLMTPVRTFEKALRLLAAPR